jgi:hypothetical protein
MDVKAFYKKLLPLYRTRNSGAIIQTVIEFKKSPDFKALHQKLVREKKIPRETNSLSEVLCAIVNDLSTALAVGPHILEEENYFEFAELLRTEFSSELAEIYTETRMPSDFLLNLRNNSSEDEKLTETLIRRYKQEYKRIKRGLIATREALQPASSFPISHCYKLHEALQGLFSALAGNRQAILAKPFILRILEIGETSGTKKRAHPNDLDSSNFNFFKHYTKTGIEPSLGDQIELQLAIRKLFLCIRDEQLMPQQEATAYWQKIAKLLSCKPSVTLPSTTRHILEDLLLQVNSDLLSITRSLSKILLEEYRDAEGVMLLQYRLIETELLYSAEYLHRLKTGQYKPKHLDEEKIELVWEKLYFLQEIFPLVDFKRDILKNTDTHRLERSAFGVSAEVNAKQIAEWIRIYSILFSNTDIVSFSRSDVDFSVMRNLISHLTSYHLIRNITLLKNLIEKTLIMPEDELKNRFRLFNDALKLKLSGLIHPTKNREKGFQEMIEDLGFIQNKKIQFVVADTFKGFQEIADAFNKSANDYFVQDREALMKEARTLYDDICTQCLKGLVYRKKSSTPEHDQAALSRYDQSTGKRSWISWVFSSE